MGVQQVEIGATLGTDAVQWRFVSGLQPSILIGRQHNRPIALIEWRTGSGFRLTTCRGEQLGDHATVDDAKRALDERLS